MADHATDEKWSRWRVAFVAGRAEDTGRAPTDFGRLSGQTRIVTLPREMAVPALTEAIRAWAASPTPTGPSTCQSCWPGTRPATPGRTHPDRTCDDSPYEPGQP
jgi:hypothetical protein